MWRYSFVLGGILTAIAWLIFWPEEESISDVPIVVQKSRPALRNPEQLQDLSERLKDSSDRVKQRDAGRELAELRESEIHGLLLEMVGQYSGNRWNYPEAAKLLFVELGRRDAAMALSWVWENLREARGWSHAFEQIGPQWAYDDPEGFFDFAKDHLRKGIHERDLTMKELLASPDPILGRDDASSVQLWLVKNSPRLAFQFLRHSRSTMHQTDMIASLHTESDFAAALSAWDDYDPEVERKMKEALDEAIAKKNANPGDEALEKASRSMSWQFQMVKHPTRHSAVRNISRRWKEKDPEGFAASRYAGWDQRTN